MDYCAYSDFWYPWIHGDVVSIIQIDVMYRQLQPISFIVWWSSCRTTNNLTTTYNNKQIRLLPEQTHRTSKPMHTTMYEYLSNYCKHNTTINSRYTVYFTQFYTDHVLGGSMSGLACVFQHKWTPIKRESSTSLRRKMVFLNSSSFFT